MALGVGDVLLAVIPTLRNPKEKFLIVVCCEDPVRVVLINTTNRAQILNNPGLGPTQVYVTPKDLPCLKYNSWIGCEELFSGWTSDELSGLAEGGAKCATLSPELLQKVMVAISESPTIVEKQKVRCKAAIEAVLKGSG